MRILTYNTWLLPQLRWPRIGLVRDHLDAEQNLRAPLIATAIDDDVDVVVLQEVFDRNARRQLLEKLHHHPHQTAPLKARRLPFDRRPGGVVICSRTPILAQAQLVFSMSTGLDQGLTKGAVYARIQAEGGKTMHVVGTHLQAHRGPRRQAIRRTQLREIRAWVEQMGVPKDDVVLFAGDFNVPADDADELAQMLAILDAEIPFAVPAGAATYDPTANTLCREQDREWLDYVLVQRRHPPCAEAQMRLFCPVASHEKNGQQRPLSDHFGVDVTLRF